MPQDGHLPGAGRADSSVADGDFPDVPTDVPAERSRWSMRLMLALTRIVIRFPVTTVALAVGLAGICVLYAATHLGYKSSRLDLLNPNSDHNRLWIDYIHEFGDEDDAVLVVEGPGRDQVVPVLEELSAGMNREKRLFHAILHEVDLTKIRAKGLHMLPLAELQKLPISLERGLPIIGGEWWRLQIGAQVLGQVQMLQAAMAATPGLDVKSALAQLEKLADGLLASLGPSPQYVSPLPDEMPPGLATLSELSTEYLVANEGHMGFILLKIAVGKDELARGTEAITALRELIAESKAHHPQVKIGLTGLPIMENDEMHSSESSMFWGGLVSFVGVVIVVIAGFGGLRHAVLANIVLLIGTAWAFGYATLAIGHLNILSVTFTATLVGVGIDYGTYYVSRVYAVAARRTELRCRLDVDNSHCWAGHYYRCNDHSRGFLCHGFDEFHRNCGAGHYRRRRHLALCADRNCSCCPHWFE